MVRSLGGGAEVEVVRRWCGDGAESWRWCGVLEVVR